MFLLVTKVSLKDTGYYTALTIMNRNGGRVCGMRGRWALRVGVSWYSIGNLRPP